MIINTDKLSVRRNISGYILAFGTQDNPYSGNYDLLDLNEAKAMVDSLSHASADIAMIAEQLKNHVSALELEAQRRQEIS